MNKIGRLSGRLAPAVIAVLLFILASRPAHGAEATMEIMNLDSQILANNPLHDPEVRHIAIFSPAQATNGAKLPLVYYLPWYGAGSQDSINDSNGWIHFTAAISAEVTPMVFVVVDCKTRWGGSQYVNSPAQGNYEDFVCDEVASAVEILHPPPDTGVKRIVAGLSSGGYGALRLGMDRQKGIDAVIALSPDANFAVTQLPLAEVAKVTNVPLSQVELIEHGKAPMPNDDLKYAFALCAAYAPSGTDHPGEFQWLFDDKGRERDDVRDLWLENDPMVMAQHDLNSFGTGEMVYLDGAEHDEYKANIGAKSVFDALRNHPVKSVFYQPPGHHAEHARERLRRGLEWVFGKPLTDVK